MKGFQLKLIKHWYSLLEGWVEYLVNKNKKVEIKDKIKIVCYEELTSTTVKEIKSITNFLHLPETNLSYQKNRQKCLENDLAGKFKREKSWQNIEVYDKKVLEDLLVYIEKATNLLLKHKIKEASCVQGYVDFVKISIQQKIKEEKFDKEVLEMKS